LNKKSVSPHGDPIVGSNFALNNPTTCGSIDAGEINPRLILQRSDVSAISRCIGKPLFRLVSPGEQLAERFLIAGLTCKKNIVLLIENTTREVGRGRQSQTAVQNMLVFRTQRIFERKHSGEGKTIKEGRSTALSRTREFQVSNRKCIFL